jgi:hypothetical protein
VDLHARKVTVLPGSTTLALTLEEERRIVEATEKGEAQGWDVSSEHKWQ